MAQGSESFERKIKVMLDVALRRFGRNGQCSDEQLEIERKAAVNVLAQLGVTP
jgi:hypothetical protein